LHGIVTPSLKFTLSRSAPRRRVFNITTAQVTCPERGLRWEKCSITLIQYYVIVGGEVRENKNSIPRRYAKWWWRWLLVPKSPFFNSYQVRISRKSHGYVAILRNLSCIWYTVICCFFRLHLKAIGHLLFIRVSTILRNADCRF
jgi:hypothetical protein